jgi:hypothetical protein
MLTFNVIPVDGLNKANASHLIEVLSCLAASGVSPGKIVRQRQTDRHNLLAQMITRWSVRQYGQLRK